MNKRVVLAYSGDVETAAAIPALAERHHAEIITLTLDLGGGRDLEEARDRALAAGAVRAHVIDVRDEFVRDYVLPSLRAGAFQDGGDPMAGTLARALVRRKLAEVAQIEHADEVIDRFQVDENLWGREGSSFVLTSSNEAPDTPARVEIAFEHGVPVAVNGVPMGMTELIESLTLIAGHHGIGRLQRVGTYVEAPAAVLLRAAQAALESAVLTDEAFREKRDRAAVYLDLMSKGLWFTAERETMDSLNAVQHDDVTGSVRIRLFKGTLQTSETSVSDYAGAQRT